MAAEYKRRAAEQLEAIVSYIAQRAEGGALIVGVAHGHQLLQALFEEP